MFSASCAEFSNWETFAIGCGAVAGVGLVNCKAIQRYKNCKEYCIEEKLEFKPNEQVPMLFIGNVMGAISGAASGLAMTTTPGFLFFSCITSGFFLAKAVVYKLEKDDIKNK